MIVTEEFQKLLSFTVGLFESFGQDQGETGSHVLILVRPEWFIEIAETNGVNINIYNQGRI